MNPLQLQNLLEEQWNEKFRINCKCPYCEMISPFLFSITKASIRLDCSKCKKVFFYRRINLARRE